MEVAGFWVLVMVIAAMFGFYQTYHWDIVTIVFAMAAMVPGAAAVADYFLYPVTRARLGHDNKFAITFLIIVSVLAFLVFANGKSDFRRAHHPIGHYAALWCLVFPYCCGVLVALDRLFNAFGGRRAQEPHELLSEDQVDWRKVYEEKFGPYRDEEEEPSETEAVIKFDPKRFH